MSSPHDPHADEPPATAEVTVVLAPVVEQPMLDARQRLTLRNYLWIAGAAIVIGLGLRYLGPVLTPFLIGAILAYLGKPLVHWAAARGISRALSTTVVVVLFGLAILALFLVLVPLVQSEVALAARRMPDLVDAGGGALRAVGRGEARHPPRLRPGIDTHARDREHGRGARPVAAAPRRGSRRAA